MGKVLSFYIAAAVFAACLTGCQAGKDSAAANQDTGEALVVYSPHPLEFINPVVAEFEMRTGIRVEVYTGGTGELLNRVETGAKPECDVFWGGSLSTTAPKKDLFEPYTSINEPMILDEYKNREGNVTRFTDIPSVLMVNENLVGDISIKGYEDLLNPELKGRIAMCNPDLSSSAYEHLINMLYAMGNGEPEAGWPYVEAFIGNLDGKLLSGSSEVYKGVAEGRYAVGLTFEEGAARFVSDDSPVKLVYMKEGVISKPDAVCIIKGTSHMEAARAYVDFVTGKDAQTVISSGLNRRSVRQDVEEPDYLPDKAQIPVIYDDEETVNHNKEMWLARFSDIFLKSLPECGV